MVILMDLKKYGIRCLLCISTVILLLSGCSKVDTTGPTGASSLTPTISLASSASQVTNGSTFTVSVNAANVTNLFGVAFDLQYDKTVFTETAIADGGFLAPTVDVWYGGPDTLTGNFTVGATSTASATGVRTGASDSGTLCTITFKAISTGSAKEIKIATGSAKIYDTSLNQTAPDIGSSVTITVN